MKSRWVNPRRALPLLVLVLGMEPAVHPAAPLSVVHWGTDQGLEAGPIGCVLETRDGYLWFGGEEGLMRFDGVRATVFSPRNTPQFKAKLISVLHEDQKGGLWVGTAGGGLVYRSAAGDWQAYGPDAGLVNERVSAIAQDATGRLWVGTDGGGIFIGENGRFEPFAENELLPTRHIEALVVEGADTIWVGSGWPLCRIRAGKFDSSFAPSGEGPRSSFALLLRADGALWVGGREGLFVLQSNQFTRALPGFDFGYVQGVSLGIKGRLWVATRDGLIRLEGDRATRFTMADGLSGNMIKSIQRDAEGSIWVTSEVPGIDQLRNTKFASISSDPAHSQQLATAIYEDSAGALWVGGHHGISRMADAETQHWGVNDGLAADLVFSICEGADKELWVGTAGGLNRLRNGEWSLFGAEEGMPHRVAWCLYQGRGGEVWAGTLRGLVRIENGGVQVFSHDDSGLSHGDVRAICEDAAGRLWVGTSYGLNLREGDQFKTFLEGAPEVQFNAVLALHGDAEGDVWIGTMEQGLFRWRDGHFTHFNSAMGLHDDLIFRILEDDSGHLWMSCNRGIFRVSKGHLNAFAEGKLQRIECDVFGKSDGLPSIECNGTFQPAGWKSKDGRLWFPTSKGVAVVDPGNLPRNMRAPPVIIEEVLANGERVDAAGEVRLGPGARDLSIRYTALSFVAPKQVQFRYQLEGVDEDWLSETTDRSARYTHLPPGDYTFRVIAANNDGVWNETGASLALEVLPFWWQTRWFMVLAGITAAGSIGGAARLWTARRYRRRMAELEHQHALERERNRIATDLHDDLGSNLGSIALLSASARKNASGEEAEDFAEIQQLAESTAESMRDIVWFIDSSEHELQPLALRMKETAARLLAEVSWEFHAPPELPSRNLSTEFKRHFFLIYKESLHNIRKHARATKVRIDLSVSGEQVELVIADNGLGFVDGGAHAGLGLNSMRRRASALGWILNIGNGPERGTRIHLVASLPSQEALLEG